MKSLLQSSLFFLMILSLPLTSLAASPQQKSVDEHFMQLAVEHAKNNLQAPFAALIVENKTGKILAKGLNKSTYNPVLHGEIDAIMNFVQSKNENWKDVTLYTTAEPCPMCQGAIIWSGIPRVVYGTSIENLKKHGWHVIEIHAANVNQHAAFYHGEILGHVLTEKTDPLFDKTKANVSNAGATR